MLHCTMLASHFARGNSWFLERIEALKNRVAADGSSQSGVSRGTHRALEQRNT
jgi:hypothetical protein